MRGTHSTSIYNPSRTSEKWVDSTQKTSDSSFKRLVNATKPACQMASTIFCCTNLQPYRPRTLDHELKFTDFMCWAKRVTPSSECDAATKPAIKSSTANNFPYAIQLVRQVNYGELESKRYFVPIDKGLSGIRDFLELNEQDLINANFAKVNS